MYRLGERPTGCEARHLPFLFKQVIREAQTRSTTVTLLILVVDDEPDVELLFRQHFRRDLRERPVHDGICAIRRHGASAHY